MKWLLALALLVLPLEAAADPASAKAWLCQRSPGLTMCRTAESVPPRPPAAMPEEEPIDYLPMPEVRLVPEHEPAPVPAPPVASPPATVPDKPGPEAAPMHQPAPAPTPAKAKPKARAIEPRTDPPARKPQTVARPSSGMCAQIAMGIAALGKAGVIAEARRRGYSAGQVAAAARACGY